MLRFDGQDIATDRLCLFRFVERAIEFSLQDGFSNPSCRNALNLIFHSSFPPRSNFSGAVNVANRALFSRPAVPPTARLEVSCVWVQLPHQTQPRWAPPVRDSRLPLRLLLIVLKTLNVAPANEPWQ